MVSSTSFLGLLLPPTIGLLSIWSTLLMASDCHFAWPYDIWSTPTISLMNSFLILFYLMCLLIYRNIVISKTLSLFPCWLFTAQNSVLYNWMSIFIQVPNVNITTIICRQHILSLPTRDTLHGNWHMKFTNYIPCTYSLDNSDTFCQLCAGISHHKQSMRHTIYMLVKQSARNNMLTC